MAFFMEVIIHPPDNQSTSDFRTIREHLDNMVAGVGGAKAHTTETDAPKKLTYIFNDPRCTTHSMDFIEHYVRQHVGTKYIAKFERFKKEIVTA